MTQPSGAPHCTPSATKTATSARVRSPRSRMLSGYNLLTGVYSPLGTGNSLYLTIDAYLNNVAYQALNGMNGTVGVYNYKTGEILCMVSTPTFDPANPPDIAADDPAWDGVYVHRLLSANSIPGSIFKVVTINAAIEEHPPTCSSASGRAPARSTSAARKSPARTLTANRTSRKRSPTRVTVSVRSAGCRTRRRNHAEIRGCGRTDQVHQGGRHPDLGRQVLISRAMTISWRGRVSVRVRIPCVRSTCSSIWARSPTAAKAAVPRLIEKIHHGLRPADRHLLSA